MKIKVVKFLELIRLPTNNQNLFSKLIKYIYIDHLSSTQINKIVFQLHPITVNFPIDILK
jgi:hypothetical protein